jgi:peptide alpha-N-acetyltransferase
MAGACAPDRGLPPKEASLFRSIVRHYDAKAYKKGIKAADAVLK